MTPVHTECLVDELVYVYVPFPVLKWSKRNESGLLRPTKVFQMFKSISCLQCGKRFKVYGTFTAHIRWCGREVCLGHIFLIAYLLR